MIRKAHPHRSVHSVTISNYTYLIRRVRYAPVPHTHLRTLRMIRKARPQLSIHFVTIRISSAEYVTVRILSATYRKTISIRAQILKNIKKSSADENNAMMRKARQEYVIIRIVSVSHSHQPIIPQPTQSCELIRFHSGRYL